MLAHDLAPLVQFLDAYVVHASPTMHTRLGVSFRDDQQRPEQRAGPQVGRELVDWPGIPRPRLPLTAQDAQAGATRDRDKSPALVVLGEVVASVPEVDEALGLQPLQEGDDLLGVGDAVGDVFAEPT